MINVRFFPIKLYMDGDKVKKVPFKGGHGHWGAHADKSTFNNPEGNFGLELDGLMTIDVDCELAAAEPILKYIPKDTPCFRTPNGTPTSRVQYLFVNPNRSWVTLVHPNSIHDHVDVKCTGWVGYPDSGIGDRRYTWITPPTNSNLREPPKEICELIAEKQKKSDAKYTCNKPIPATNEVEEYAIKLCKEHPPAIEGEGGSGVCYLLAVKLVHGLCLQPELALSFILSNYNATCTPPWSEEELWHKVTSAQNDPHPMPWGWLLPKARNQNDYTLESMAETRSYVANPKDNLIGQHWLERGEYNVLYGPNGVGKSYLATQWSVAIAKGQSFLGMTTPEAQKVLYIDIENSPTKRAKILSYYTEDTVNFMSIPRKKIKTGSALLQSLYGYKEKYDFSIVFLDNLFRMGIDLVKTEEIGRWLDELHKTLCDLQFGMQLLHHPPKGVPIGGYTTSSCGMYGSVMIPNQARGVISLHPPKTASGDDLCYKMCIEKGADELHITDSNNRVVSEMFITRVNGTFECELSKKTFNDEQNLAENINKYGVMLSNALREHFKGSKPVWKSDIITVIHKVVTHISTASMTDKPERWQFKFADAIITANFNAAGGGKWKVK